MMVSNENSSVSFGLVGILMSFELPKATAKGPFKVGKSKKQEQQGFQMDYLLLSV